MNTPAFILNEYWHFVNEVKTNTIKYNYFDSPQINNFFIFCYSDWVSFHVSHHCHWFLWKLVLNIFHVSLSIDFYQETKNNTNNNKKNCKRNLEKRPMTIVNFLFHWLVFSLLKQIRFTGSSFGVFFFFLSFFFLSIAL